MERKDTHITAKQKFFNELAQDYQQAVCELITSYQAEKFGLTNPIQMKKELLRSLGFSANVARMVMNQTVVGTSTMLHCLDLFEDILNLYDPAQLHPWRTALFKRKMYFIKTYSIILNMDKPIVQK